MNFYLKNIIFIFTVIIPGLFTPAITQDLITGFPQSISGLPGNNTNPSWSGDGSKLLFQSDRNKNWDIFMYNFENDSLLQLTNSTFNEQKPVWFPDKNSVVFVSDESGVKQLYSMDLATKEKKLLFNRKIICDEPSFSNYNSMVAFSGFEENSKTWQIYTYDFKYNNLNQLTQWPANCSNPAFSPDGKMIAFEYLPKVENQQNSIYIVNWYGDLVFKSSELNFFNPSWTPDSFRIIYIDANNGNDVNSMRKDGSSVFKITNDPIVERFPVISPDGKFMAMSVLKDGHYELVVNKMEE